MIAEDLQIGRHPLPLTDHPPWLAAMIGSLEECWQRAAWPRLFAETARGELPPLAAWRRVLADFFVIIESFPKYLALSLAKTTYGQRAGDARVRRWLLQNIAIEGRHAEWYLDWLDGVGISAAEVVSHRPCDEVLALHQHLWRACEHGSLPEGIAATNWAIEGVTGVWARGVAEPFGAYEEEGVRIDAKSMMWLNAHARYGEAHPDEALEALKIYVDGYADGGRRGNPLGVQWAARRALELFADAVERSYDLGLE